MSQDLGIQREAADALRLDGAPALAVAKEDSSRRDATPR